MKQLAKVLFALAMCCVLAVGAYLLSSVLRVEFLADIIPAEKNAELFEQKNTGEDISSCYFVTVQANIASYSPFKSEWMTLNIDSENGDIVIAASNAGPNDSEGFSMSTMYMTILTQNPEKYRAGRLEYYILGRYHCIDVEY